jgi:hypothetical protein
MIITMMTIMMVKVIMKTMVIVVSLLLIPKRK